MEMDARHTRGAADDVCMCEGVRRDKRRPLLDPFVAYTVRRRETAAGPSFQATPFLNPPSQTWGHEEKRECSIFLIRLVFLLCIVCNLLEWREQGPLLVRWSVVLCGVDRCRGALAAGTSSCHVVTSGSWMERGRETGALLMRMRERASCFLFITMQLQLSCVQSAVVPLDLHGIQPTPSTHHPFLRDDARTQGGRGRRRNHHSSR